MLRQEPKFSFRNLEPISYLKNFNSMVDYNARHPLKISPRHELKTVSLTKFPLPHYYQDMQGIFESAGRKKVNPNTSNQNSSQVQEQEFMKKHNEFMRKVLTRFIDHNESRQSLYEKEKKYIAKNQVIKKHGRAVSQPKLKKANTNKQIDTNPEASPSLLAPATKGSSVKLEQQQQNEKPKSVLPALKPRRKKEKLTFRNEKKVQEFILSRKLGTPSGSKSEKRPITSEEVPLDFREEIVNIELQQVQKQETFAERVKKQIAQFDKKMDIQVHAIKYYSFWRTGASTEEEGRAVRDDQISERVDYAVKFGNYTAR